MSDTLNFIVAKNRNFATEDNVRDTKDVYQFGTIFTTIFNS